MAEDATLLEERTVLSVRELNERIATRIDDTPGLQDVVCRGEVSDLHETQTAVYFSLVDAEAELDCVYWQNRYQQTDLELEAGMDILVAGDVEYYIEKGRLNIKPWEVTALGEGEQFAALRRRRDELANRGWFDDVHKQALPALPSTVGVVTSHDGDARYDIQDAIHSRYPDVDIRVCHASVQGDAAPTTIAAGIEHLDATPVDVIITGRGGGSDEALMAFNSEGVAAAIFHAETPIVTGIGHQDDETIADLVADHAAITPTAAGEAVVPAKDQLVDEVAALTERLEDSYSTHVRAELDDVATELHTAYTQLVDDRITDLETRLNRAYREFEHEREKTRIERDAERRTRRYKLIIGGLLVVLVLVLLWLLT